MAASIHLYHSSFSQNAVRPVLALLEKGVPFETHEVDLFKGEHRQPPLSELTPRGQVPTVVYKAEGQAPVVVYESIATLYFLEDMFPEPALLPPTSAPAQRALAHMRIAEFQAKLDVRNIFGSVAFRQQGRAELGERVDNLVRELETWNGYLADQAYLAGAHFGLADIAVFPLLMHFEALGFPYAERTPALAAYIARCTARPSVQQSGWLEAFGQFVAARDVERVLAE